MIKKIAYCFAGLIVILVAAGGFLFFNLDHIIKNAVEKYASAATQTTVGLDSVKLSLTSGNGTLSGLSVGNPKGFSAAKAFYLGSIAVQLDTGSLKGTGPIVISSINIDKPQVTYELLNSGTSNLQTIQNNTKSYANSLQGQKPGAPGAAKKEIATPGNEHPSQPSRKIIIKDLTIKDGQIAISQELLKGKQLSSGLPDIHLTNIGQASGGATAAQVAEQIFSAISNAAAQSAVTELAKEKISGVLQAVPAGAIGGAAVDTIGNQVKGVFGQ